MITLSEEQIRDLKNNGKNPPTVVNPMTHEEFVLIPRDSYDRLRALLDSDFSTEGAFLAQIESAAAAGWDDPALDIYNDFETHNR